MVQSEGELGELFILFDHKEQGWVPSEQLGCGLAVLCRSKRAERLRMSLAVVDRQGNGRCVVSKLWVADVVCRVTVAELIEILKAICDDAVSEALLSRICEAVLDSEGFGTVESILQSPQNHRSQSIHLSIASKHVLSQSFRLV